MTLVIQRPESILRPASATEARNNNQKVKKDLKNVGPQGNTSPRQPLTPITPITPTSTNSWAEPSNTEGRYFTETAFLDDIKIDGMSVYKGELQPDLLTDLSKPTIVITDSNESRVESFISSTNLRNPTHHALSNTAHRRINSESSVAVLNGMMGGARDSPNLPPSSSSQERVNHDVNSGMVLD